MTATRLDDDIEIQTFAMMRALDARLAADPRTSGLSLPDEFQYHPMGSGQAHVHYGIGWYPQGGLDRRGRAPDQEIRSISAAWDRDNPGYVDPETLTSLQQHAQMAMRMVVQACAPFHAPTWAALVHPVLLALLLGHDPDRGIMPLGTQARDLDATRRWPVDDLGNPTHTGTNGTTATGECWMEGGVLRCSRMGVITPDMSAVTVVSTSAGTTMSMPCALPETVATAGLAGRRLGDVVRMPPTGHAEVDALAADCRIQGMRKLAAGISVSFEPVRFTPYGIPPAGDVARAMDLAPHIQ